MRIIDKFIGQQLFWPFLFGVGAFTSVFFGAQHIVELAQYVLQGMPALTALELTLLFLPSIIVFTLPMSCLVAVLVAFSRMSMESEIIALYASGVSLYRSVIPVVWLGILVTGLGYGMNEYIVPESAKLTKEITAQALKQKLVTNEPIVFMDQGTGTIIYVGGGLQSRDKSVVMRNIIVTKRNGDTPVLVVQADEARWNEGFNWKLFDGVWREFQPDGSTVTIQFHGMQMREIEIHESPDDILRRQKKPEEMSFRELKGYIKDLGAGVPPKELLKDQVQLYNKLAIPLAALVFAFVSAPLAVSQRRGSASVGIGLSIVVIFAYWFIWATGTALATAGNVSPMVGAFTADVFGLILGLFLLIRAAK